MRLEKMESIPAGSNPFHYDHISVGMRVSDFLPCEYLPAVYIMYDPWEGPYLYDSNTGERYRLHLGETETKYDVPILRPQQVMTREDWLERIQSHSFTDYDGFAHASDGKHINKDRVYRPSEASELPDNASHVVWYNR